jgi:hypothetical protein
MAANQRVGRVLSSVHFDMPMTGLDRRLGNGIIAHITAIGNTVMFVLAQPVKPVSDICITQAQDGHQVGITSRGKSAQKA